MITKKNTCALIIGAGPSGLMLACQLIKYRVPFLIIDKKKTISEWVKACMLSSHSLEILYDLGLAQKLTSLGQKVTGYEVYHGGCVIDFPYSSIETRFPFNLHLDQPYIEKILYEYLLQNKHDILWEHELLSFSQNKDGVVATIKKNENEIKISAAFLIGADGASSQVRKQCDIAFVGKTYPHYFLLGTVELDWQFSSEKARIFFSDHGFLSVYPLANQRMQVGGNIAYHPANKNPEANELKKLFEDRCRLAGSIKNTEQLSYYQTHCRFANERVIHRVVFIGDAAHILSPLTGLGMNLGIQDAYNVAWKLSLIYRKISPFSLLNSYAEEQQSIFKKLRSLSNILEAVYIADVKNTHDLRQFMITSSVVYESIRHREIGRLMQTDLCYQRCQLFQNHIKDSLIKSGMRCPNPKIKNNYFLDQLDSENHVLLIFSGVNEKNKIDFYDWMQFSKKQSFLSWIKFYFIDAEEKSSPLEFLKIMVDSEKIIHQAFDIAEPAIYFIRPDRYIAYCDEKYRAHQFLDYLEKNYILMMD